MSSSSSPSPSPSADTADVHLQDWNLEVGTAEMMIPLLGKLYRESHVVCTVFGLALHNKGQIDIMKAHRSSKHLLGRDGLLTVNDTVSYLQALSAIKLNPCKCDLGKMFVQHRKDTETAKAKKEEPLSIELYVRRVVTPNICDGTPRKSLLDTPQDVVLYGFGRIGRLLARILIEKTASGGNLLLRGIVLRKSGIKDDLLKRASLLRRDSVHGPFQGHITVDTEKSVLIVNGNVIKMIYSDGPDKVNYEEYGFKDVIVVDNTGKWRTGEALALHLKSAGVSKVLLTAPGSDIPNIVFGVNDDLITSKEKLYSAASCTTNAVTPIAYALTQRYNVQHLHIETVHSYTTDQNLVDNMHGKSRRGRAAPLNIVVTETGAGVALAKTVPYLNGKLSASAIRVPTPNVSLAILNFTLDPATPVTREELNSYLRSLSLDSKLSRQIDYVTSNSVVSSDFVGSRSTSTVDSASTKVVGNNATLYCWYDNEAGYSAQVIRILQRMAGLLLPNFPAWSGEPGSQLLGSIST
eukprot:TRINITY_DN6146_c0_g1_i1.p1 TRINITY_DN6146_c0_g1~~TRINITY_DN6146_c0_g1_i1.p1  ORF type:complete len:581 (+),score=111.14 TRINITY_DN6146_c0_g1_i1:180-1745(+)